MLVVNVQPIRYQLMENYLLFHVCGSSFTNDNTVLSVSLEGSVNMIADSVGSAVLQNIT
jgi:hypothetical protein